MPNMPGKLRLKHLTVESLVQYARNARTHGDAQVAQNGASIDEFGWTNPVFVDGNNGIITGHGRVPGGVGGGALRGPYLPDCGILACF